MVSTVNELQIEKISGAKDHCHNFKVAWCEQGDSNMVSIYDEAINLKSNFKGSGQVNGKSRFKGAMILIIIMCLQDGTH